MAKTLVTGGGGFIGSHLVRTLVSRGDDVACLVRSNSSRERLASLKVRFLSGDVTNVSEVHAAVAGCEIVFHIAGCLYPVSSRDFYRVNTHGTENVVQACAAQESPPLLVILSSLAAAGPCREGRPLRESDPPRPICHYGRSKRGGELAAQRAAGKVPITILRPPGVFGEGDRESLAMFLPVARYGLYGYPVWPTLGLSLIHVDDLVLLILLAAERGQRLPPDCEGVDVPERGVYYASSGEHLIGAEWGKTLAESLGRELRWSVPVPSPLLWPAAALSQTVSLFTRRRPLFSWDRARVATAGQWLCSPRLAVEELGFSPGGTLLERLRQTVAWYRQVAWLQD